VIALGSKPGVAFWMLLGLAAALWQAERQVFAPTDDNVGQQP